MGDMPTFASNATSLNPEQTRAWHVLQAMSGNYGQCFDLRDAFAQDPSRFDQLSLRPPHMLVDLSKNLWDQEVIRILVELAEATDVRGQITQLLSGKVVNHTEHQPAIHSLLRQTYSRGTWQSGSSIRSACEDIDAFLVLAQRIRDRNDIHDVIHIGIGGSSVGPELALQALRPFQSAPQRLHVVSNLDGHDLAETLANCDPAHTVIVAASKSWSTFETMQNLRSAVRWLQFAGQSVEDRVIAITAKPAAAQAEGFEQVLRMPVDIGGRFSLWSAVGLPLAIAIGPDHFKRMHEGAAAMDTHFAEAPLQSNAPVLLGLLDVWYSSFLGMTSRCIVPYHHRLRRLPAYLQQLEMESNGKRVMRSGEAVDYATAMVSWGEAGTNGQHAFFQYLHQGTQRIPVELIATSQCDHGLPGHHEALLANAIAQAQALMTGASAGHDQLRGHQDFPGNRPSTFILLEGALNPAALGALLALYEHRTFVSSAVWSINCFDQWGVELGKQLAKDILQRMPHTDTQGLDASTAGLLNAVAQPSKCEP